MKAILYKLLFLAVFFSACKPETSEKKDNYFIDRVNYVINSSIPLERYNNYPNLEERLIDTKRTFKMPNGNSELDVFFISFESNNWEFMICHYKGVEVDYLFPITDFYFHHLMTDFLGGKDSPGCKSDFYLQLLIEGSITFEKHLNYIIERDSYFRNSDSTTNISNVVYFLDAVMLHGNSSKVINPNIFGGLEERIRQDTLHRKPEEAIFFSNLLDSIKPIIEKEDSTMRIYQTDFNRTFYGVKIEKDRPSIKLDLLGREYFNPILF